MNDLVYLIFELVILGFGFAILMQVPLFEPYRMVVQGLAAILLIVILYQFFLGAGLFPVGRRHG